MKGTKQTITIKTMDRRGRERPPQDVEAIVYGQYAVHKQPDGLLGQGRYTVTHTPSGYNLLTGTTQARVREIAVACAPLDMPYASREAFPREQLDLLFRTMQSAKGF